jgi:hypothetical protein
MLLPGTTTSCTVTKAATQDNFEAGGMNLAVSAAATPSGTNTTVATADTSEALVLPITRQLVLTLTRTDSTNVVDRADAVAHMTLTAGNGGNVHLKSVTVVVPGLDGITCSAGANTVTLPADLLVGSSLTCIGSFAFSQDALEAGSRNFSAAGSASNLGAAGAASNVVEVVVAASPQLQLDVDALNCSRPARMRE